MSEHTPGPWHTHGTAIHAQYRYAGRKHHHHVAEVSPLVSAEAHGDIGTPEANARLIAAAPDLLEDRKRRLDQEERFLAAMSPADRAIGGMAVLLKAWIKEDRAAIAKAEGRTP